MIIFIRNCHLKQLEKIMSKFLDDFHALLDKVTSTQNDSAAIKELQDHLASNDATDEEQSQAILELAQKLGEAPPTGGEGEGGGEGK